MQEPTNIKGQQLTRRLAALSRFISRLEERTLPFYQLLKKGEKFEWTEEACNAFAYLKKTLSTPPILAVPKEREPLYLYIAARSSVVSTALVVERTEEGKVQSILAANLLPQRCPHEISAAAPALPEARICHCHDITESNTLSS